MKKILVLAGFLIIFSLSPRLINAQELTRADVETTKPQLVGLVSSLGNSAGYIQARIATENALFRQYGNLLGVVSLRLSQTPAPTSAELQNLELTLAKMQRLTTTSLNWRADVEARTSIIVKILGNIGSMIASAV